MSKLERVRRGRSLHVSRGQLAAAGVGAVLAVALGYFAGLWNGLNQGFDNGFRASARNVPNEELIDLLARLEAVNAGQEADLTQIYDEALRGASASEPALPQREAEAGSGAVVRAAAVDVPVSDPPPGGAFGVVAFSGDLAEAATRARAVLQEAGFDARLVATGDANGVQFELVVGGFDTEDSANLAAVDIWAALNRKGLGAQQTGVRRL